MTDAEFDRVRAMAVPFCMVLFPAVHYVGRNLTTARLSPQVDPSPALIAAGLGGAVLLASVFAATLSAFRRQGVTDERQLPRAQRLFQLDDRSLLIFGLFVALAGLWAIAALGGIGPDWFGAVLGVLVAPLGLPLLVLAPLAIASHLAVVAGYALSAIWMGLLATLVSDLTYRLED